MTSWDGAGAPDGRLQGAPAACYLASRPPSLADQPNCSVCAPTSHPACQLMHPPLRNIVQQLVGGEMPAVGGVALAVQVRGQHHQQVIVVRQSGLGSSSMGWRQQNADPQLNIRSWRTGAAMRQALQRKLIIAGVSAYAMQTPMPPRHLTVTAGHTTRCAHPHGACVQDLHELAVAQLATAECIHSVPAGRRVEWGSAGRDQRSNSRCPGASFRVQQARAGDGSTGAQLNETRPAPTLASSRQVAHRTLRSSDCSRFCRRVGQDGCDGTRLNVLIPAASVGRRTKRKRASASARCTLPSGTGCPHFVNRLLHGVPVRLRPPRSHAQRVLGQPLVILHTHVDNHKQLCLAHCQR